MIRVLQISPYPTLVPRHGGQVRAFHIRRVLRGLGVSVTHIDVFDYARSPGQRPDIELTQSRAPERYAHPQIADLAAGIALSKSSGALSSLSQTIERYVPDIVMVEEPWLWPGLQMLGLGAPILYNAYNIEHKLKRSILLGSQIPDADALVSEIRSVEESITMSAHGCSSVTESDASVLSEWTQKPVIVAGNGTVLRKLKNLGGILPEVLHPDEKFLLFVSSGHWPNITGFVDMVVPSIRTIRSSERIVVVGGICDPLSSLLQRSETRYSARDRIVLLGEVSDHYLDCLIANAAGILLPITYGGGSNLKTAEALASGKPIVATTAAFRGYEEFVGSPAVIIGGTPLEFAAGMRTVLDGLAPPPPRSGLEALSWEHKVLPIYRLIKQITAG